MSISTNRHRLLVSLSVSDGDLDQALYDLLAESETFNRLMDHFEEILASRLNRRRKAEALRLLLGLTAKQLVEVHATIEEAASGEPPSRLAHARETLHAYLRIGRPQEPAP